MILIFTVPLKSQLNTIITLITNICFPSYTLVDAITAIPSTACYHGLRLTPSNHLHYFHYHLSSPPLFCNTVTTTIVNHYLHPTSCLPSPPCCIMSIQHHRHNRHHLLGSKTSPLFCLFLSFHSPSLPFVCLVAFVCRAMKNDYFFAINYHPPLLNG